MIKKLRVKLIAVSMLSLLVVLLLIMTGVNILNYHRVVTKADSILHVLKNNQGTFPKKNMGKVPSPTGTDKNMSPELPYKSRYFSVLLTEEGDVILTDTEKVAAIDDDEAVEAAKDVLNRKSKYGFYNDYRYVRCNENGNIRIIFLDWSEYLSSFRTVLIASYGTAALGFLAVFVLILIFSGRIVKTISESYEKQKRFISDAGHEIKTPITIIRADTEVLAMDMEKNEWLEDIQLQTERLALLTDDLLYLSRMEEGRHPLQMIEFPLSDLVTDILFSFQSAAKLQHKTIHCDIQPMLALKGDTKTLSQLVSILMENALKYSPEYSEIRISLKKQGRTVNFSVENTANYDLPEELDQLFDRFYQADQSRSSQTGGYGLGLSIAKAITDAHKGKITALRKDARHLTIVVTLPANL